MAEAQTGLQPPARSKDEESRIQQFPCKDSAQQEHRTDQASQTRDGYDAQCRQRLEAGERHQEQRRRGWVRAKFSRIFPVPYPILTRLPTKPFAVVEFRRVSA